MKLFAYPSLLTLVLITFGSILSGTAQVADLSDQVVIRRTTHGIPHIKANNMLAAGYALGYVQMEDYGRTVSDGIVKARGQWTRFNDLSDDQRRQSIDNDASAQLRHRRAVEVFGLLKRDTRDIITGFAAGVNKYIELHPAEFQDWLKPDFAAQDILAVDIGGHSSGAVSSFIRRLQRNTAPSTGFLDPGENNTVWARIAETSEEPHPDEGSNTWALAPNRTKSGNAILMRNPHLNWNAGYYECHLEILGVLNFYGDFRIGGPLVTIGGFNEKLGFSTTNNDPDTDEIYSFKLSPSDPDYYMVDGLPVPIEKKQVSVDINKGDGVSSETREFMYTKFGPVFHRDKAKLYVIRDAGEGEYRLAEQFLEMMKARNLEEYKQAMRIQAKTSSNFTYADAAGNIYYVWNAMTPDLPVPSGGDTTAIEVSRSEQVWKNIIPFDSLPQLLNPRGGYLHNENDPFHYTNLNEVLKGSDFPQHFSEPRLRLRSQHALDLIANNKKFSLADIVKMKYSMRLVLAERVKSDLIRAVKKQNPTGEILEAINQIAAWDNSVERESKGGVLFETWWERYVELSNGGKRVAASSASAGYAAAADSLFAEIWSPAKPATTPRGLASLSRAAEAFIWAVTECNKRYGSWNLAWGDVNRARIGETDLPVGGANGELGAFSVLWFIPHKTDSLKREARGGDGWIIAVEFGKTPKAYSVLAYGQSNKPGSPYFADQLQMFTDKKMKPVAFTEGEIKKQILKEYRPGRK